MVGSRGSVWFLEAPKDAGAGVGVNPSRGPAPPSAPTRPLPSPLWAVRHPPSAWQGSPIQTPDPTKPLTAVRAFLESQSCDLVFRKTLGQQLVARVPLAAHPVSPLPQRQGGAPLPQREAVPRALRSRRSHAFLAAEGGAC